MQNSPLLLVPCLILLALTADCRPPEGWKDRPAGGQQTTVSFRNNCNQATQRTDLNINNVRARLLNGGDMWFDIDSPDGENGGYFVPKAQPGQPEVSALGAGGLWLGGMDEAGNLKLACQTYRSASKTDFWPGPLDDDDGSVSQLECWKWDRFFRVLAADIRAHKTLFQDHQLNGTAYPPDEIPKDIKGWPARGNPFFYDVHQFALPNSNKGLAYFFDNNGNGSYEPQLGDYPALDVRGCDGNRFPDEMVFWIFNDNGGNHTQTNASPMKVEVQALSFAYATNDELNDMTFYRYKIINHALEPLDSTFFAIWIDPDLGCPGDDYIGCDTTLTKVDTVHYEDASGNPKTEFRNRGRDLMYVYNKDATDGMNGCDCGPTATYCNETPMLGVDFLRGPLDEHGAELGMSSFIYWQRDNVLGIPTDPIGPQNFYNYLNGRWAEGTPMTQGGNGYNIGSTDITKFAFSSPPNDPNGWSMCSENLPDNDYRTLQAAGPFRLLPGTVNELIIGVPWVPNIQYPCPDLEPLLYADHVAQTFFDHCFEMPEGPDAPDLDFLELDRELICLLSNDGSSNNFQESHSWANIFAPETYLGAPLTDVQRSYQFEGYKVFQLKNPNITRAEISDIEKARIVFQCDLKNGVSKIFDWQPVPSPTGATAWRPVEKVDGQNAGIAHSFQISEDQFAEKGRALINHRKYHYLAVAYSFNNFAAIDPKYSKTGQQVNYLEGRLNVRPYTVVPRPIVDRAVQANFGDGPEIAGHEGRGIGHIAVQLRPGEHDSILAGNNSALDYMAGKAPISIKIYDPLNVKDGAFDLFVVDKNLSDNVLDMDARWILVNAETGETLFSERSLAVLNEQLVGQYGFSVTVAQTAEAGAPASGANGAIEQAVRFADPQNAWLGAVPDSPQPVAYGTTPLHFIGTEVGEPYHDLDPDQAFSDFGERWFAPYLLTMNQDPVGQLDFTVSPRWCPPNYRFSELTNDSTSLADLNNVDIVFTDDTAKWSRCIIVETASASYTGTGSTDLDFETESGPGWRRKSMDTRYALSVGKRDADNDGRPDPDGAMDGGQPLRGMGWFPGYCVDVETGERLNIFFGENSIYNGIPDGGQNWPDEPANGADMMFNPTDLAVRLPIDDPAKFNPYSFPLGGQHFVYVTRQKYDGCAGIRQHLDPDKANLTIRKYVNKWKAIPLITWTGMMVLPPGKKMLPYSAGLVPGGCTVSIRADSPYGIRQATTNGHPHYSFKIVGKAAAPLDAVAIKNSLDSIKMVPNPYFAYSNYETSFATSVVKITNLPAKCTVNIYALDGRHVRMYARDEAVQSDPTRPARPIPFGQILPDLEWDMKNGNGSPVGSGVYLVHIDAPGMGERTLKWFGIGRELDGAGF